MVVAATGFFDGVHIGHQAVIRTLLERSREDDGQSLVLSFWPHPRVLLQNGARELRLLTSVDEKRDLLYSYGVERVEILPFTKEFASMDARTYLKMLKADYNVSAITLGYDNRFGRGNLSTSQVADIALQMGLRVDTVVPVDIDGLPVSSTRIRRA